MEFIVHENPVLRSKRNYIARVDLAPFGFAGQVEQLWLRPLDDADYTIACIPFRSYGLALHDRVRISPDGAWVTDLIEPSGRRVLRMLLMPGPDLAQLDQGIARVTAAIDGSSMLSEWSGHRHVAVDVPPAADLTDLISVMQRQVTHSGAFWEWADAEPFTT